MDRRNVRMAAIGVAWLWAMAARSLVGDSVLVDDFEGDRNRVSVWPADKTAVAFSDDAKNGKKALRIDLRAVSKNATLPLPLDKFQGAYPRAVRFWLKAAPGNQKNDLDILLREKTGGECYFKTVPLKPEWTPIELKRSELRIFSYGGAKLVDGKFDFDDLGSLRFSSYPGGAVFLVDDIEILTEKSLPDKAPVKSTVEKEPIPTIREIVMPAEYPDYSDKYPKKTRDVTIRDGNFVRDGKPVFLIGGWPTGNEGPPWLFRTLALDVYPYNANEIYSLYPPRREGDKLIVEWRPNDWYEAIIQRTLKNGILLWHEHTSNQRYNALRHSFPEIVDAGHFVSYDPFNPLGARFYDEMFKSWTRYTRGYPVFCYEMINEMLYNNRKKISRDMFKRRMRQKYEDVAKANKAWGTRFKSFDDVCPPGYVSEREGVRHFSVEQAELADARKYPNLNIDWRKFQEESCATAIAAVVAMARRHDPSPDRFSTLQSHCQLFMDFADAGVHPEAIAASVDFYTHEVGQGYSNQDFNESAGAAKAMTRMSLTNDIVGNICGKPIFNGESPFGVTNAGADWDELVASDLAKLPGEWKFYDATTGEPEKWMSSDFSDADWAAIQVPGMWGKQGFNKCETGLYRRHFALPAETLAKEEKLFLNGSAFADQAEIYLNGRFVGKVAGFNASFSFDVKALAKTENVIAAKIVNHYFKDDMFWGGIRGAVSLNARSCLSGRSDTLGPNHYRAHLWSQLAHGVSGVMMCYEGNLHKNAAKILPRVKKEIESVAEIVLPRPRIKANVALVYPFETNRGLTYPDYTRKLSGPATSDLLDYYAPALFSGVGVDVIANKDLLTDKAHRYRAIVMAGNLRVLPGEISALTDYVKNGGVLIADFGCLSIDDDMREALEPGSLFGARVGAFETTPQRISGGLFGDKSYGVRARFADGNARAVIQALDAETLARFDDGTPAITVRKLGKGKAYYIAGKLPYEAVEAALAAIFAANDIRPRVKILSASGAPALRFVDVNLFGENGRYVLYALNYGKKSRGFLKIAGLPAGNYRVRNIVTGNVISAPDRKETWTAADLDGRVALDFPSVDPVTLLIEDTRLTPLAIKNISPERLEILNRLWVKHETAADAPVVAFAPEPLLSKIYGEYPTAARILEIHGYAPTCFVDDKTELKDVATLVLPSARFRAKDPKEILDFVKNGGGLLLCGNGVTNYHMTQDGFAPLFKAFRVVPAPFAWLRNPNPTDDNDLLNVECEDIAPHDLTVGVKKFTTACAGGVVSRDVLGATVLIRASRASNHPGAAVMIAFAYGKGRVVYIADSWWLRPFNLDKGDNAQLFLNIVNWLSKRPPETLSPEKRAEALYISQEKLAAAEKAENEGKSAFAPLASGESALADGGPIKGLAGGDPIVDALQ